MSVAGLFEDEEPSLEIPHVDFKRDPNLPREGQRIRDLVEMDRLDPANLAEIASRLVPGTLIRWSRDSELTPDDRFAVPRGNIDIVSLVESGLFRFNIQALNAVVAKIQFSHPQIGLNDINSSSVFLKALVSSGIVPLDPELPEAILNRNDLVSDRGNAQFLADAIEAGIFAERHDLLEDVVQKLFEAKEFRNSNPAFAAGNGYWDKAYRNFELPVVKALLGAGVSIRIPTGIDAGRPAFFER